MGRWVRLSKKHPKIVDDNEVVNINTLGGKTGDQVAQGQHYFQVANDGEAQALATFLRTDSAIKLDEAEELMRENIRTRLRDGYIHAQYFNFALMKLVYVGKWDESKQQFVNN
jgi:hypothetical protein